MKDLYKASSVSQSILAQKWLEFKRVLKESGCRLGFLPQQQEANVIRVKGRYF